MEGIFLCIFFLTFIILFPVAWNAEMTNVLTFSWEKEVLLLDIFTGDYDGIQWPLWQFELDRLNLNNVL